MAAGAEWTDKALIWAGGIAATGAMGIIQWFILRTVRSMDKKFETVLVSIFGDGQDVPGILTRLKILEHDYARCCGQERIQRSGVDRRKEDV